MSKFDRLKHFDWPLFAASMILSLTGLVMIYGTSRAANIPDAQLWIKQGAALVLGLLGFFVFATLNYRFFKKNSAWLYVFSVLLLLAVLVLGSSIKGSRRWFDLGFINFQPSEFVKFAVVIALAKYFSQYGALLAKFRYVLFSGALVAVPAFLIIVQPDLGTTGILVAIWLGMLLTSPMPRRYFLYLGVIFLIAAGLSWQVALADYQKDRVRSFMNPTADPQGIGYNVIQSVVAVGSGGIFGQGLARGLQSQLRFLPERQTDFIFASAVEELGLVGGVLILSLFAFILARSAKIASRSRDLFGVYLASGIFFLLFAQVFINIGMNLGLLPVTGVTLPLVSYGGSSLMMTFWLLGIAENIARHAYPVRFT